MNFQLNKNESSAFRVTCFKINDYKLYAKVKFAGNKKNHFTNLYPAEW